MEHAQVPREGKEETYMKEYYGSAYEHTLRLIYTRLDSLEQKIDTLTKKQEPTTLMSAVFYTIKRKQPRLSDVEVQDIVDELVR